MHLLPKFFGQTAPKKIKNEWHTAMWRGKKHQWNRRKKDNSPENEKQEEHGLTENLHLNHRVEISGDCQDLKVTT